MRIGSIFKTVCLQISRDEFILGIRGRLFIQYGPKCFDWTSRSYFSGGILIVGSRILWDRRSSSLYVE